MSAFSNVKPAYFRAVYDRARRDSTMIREATSPYDIFYSARGTRYFLGSDGVNDWGYAIRPDGDLVYAFATTRGKGDAIVESALSNGAETLDCFDGYLPGFYARHGFVEYAREVNWTPGGPDVVFMATPARLAARR